MNGQRHRQGSAGWGHATSAAKVPSAVKEANMKYLLALLLLAAEEGSAEPWTVSFGGCSFSGDTNGAPLLRAGSCPIQGGELFLNSKGITEVPANAFQGMGAVAFLALYLNNNRLESLPSSVFAGLSQLVSLDLENNGLTDLPINVFAGLSKLSLLHLAGNSFTTPNIDKNNNVFFNLTALRTLQMHNNYKLTSLPIGIFFTLTELRSLYLDTTLLCLPLKPEERASVSDYRGPDNLCGPICSAGWTGISGTCSQCVAGKYKSVPESPECRDCDAGKYSVIVASSSQSTCIACPAGSYSPKANDVLAGCTCNPEWTGPDGGTCTACAAGKFKPVSGSAECKPYMPVKADAGESALHIIIGAVVGAAVSMICAFAVCYYVHKSKNKNRLEAFNRSIYSWSQSQALTAGPIEMGQRPPFMVIPENKPQENDTDIILPPPVLDSAKRKQEAERQEQESDVGVGREGAEYLEGSKFNSILNLQDALVQQVGWHGTLNKTIQVAQDSGLLEPGSFLQQAVDQFRLDTNKARTNGLTDEDTHMPTREYPPTFATRFVRGEIFDFVDRTPRSFQTKESTARDLTQRERQEEREIMNIHSLSQPEEDEESCPCDRLVVVPLVPLTPTRPTSTLTGTDIDIEESLWSPSAKGTKSNDAVGASTLRHKFATEGRIITTDQMAPKGSAGGAG